MSEFFDKHSFKIQVVLILFTAISFFCFLIGIRKEEMKAKENYKIQLIEINSKLDEIQTDIDLLKLQGGK